MKQSQKNKVNGIARINRPAFWIRMALRNPRRLTSSGPVGTAFRKKGREMQRQEEAAERKIRRYERGL